MAAPKPVAEPHKELRFTRAAQAQAFWIFGALMLALAIFLLVTWLRGHPDFSWWMPLPALAATALALKAALHCTRHAYLILTPLGVEIFPLRNPSQNLHLLYWHEIVAADFDDELTTLILHQDEEKKSGVVVSLKPILSPQRILLKKAMTGRMAEKSG